MAEPHADLVNALKKLAEQHSFNETDTIIERIKKAVQPHVEYFNKEKELYMPVIDQYLNIRKLSKDNLSIEDDTFTFAEYLGRSLVLTKHSRAHRLLMRDLQELCKAWDKQFEGRGITPSHCIFLTINPKENYIHTSMYNRSQPPDTRLIALNVSHKGFRSGVLGIIHELGHVHGQRDRSDSRFKLFKELIAYGFCLKLYSKARDKYLRYELKNDVKFDNFSLQIRRDLTDLWDALFKHLLPDVKTRINKISEFREEADKKEIHGAEKQNYAARQRFEIEQKYFSYAFPLLNRVMAEILESYTKTDHPLWDSAIFKNNKEITEHIQVSMQTLLNDNKGSKFDWIDDYRRTLDETIADVFALRIGHASLHRWLRLVLVELWELCEKKTQDFVTAVDDPPIRLRILSLCYAKNASPWDFIKLRFWVELRNRYNCLCKEDRQKWRKAIDKLQDNCEEHVLDIHNSRDENGKPKFDENDVAMYDQRQLSIYIDEQYDDEQKVYENWQGKKEAKRFCRRLFWYSLYPVRFCAVIKKYIALKAINNEKP